MNAGFGETKKKRKCENLENVPLCMSLICFVFFSFYRFTDGEFVANYGR